MWGEVWVWKFARKSENYVGKMKQTIFLETSCDNNNSPHGKFHRFLFPFSSKLPDLNFAPYILYIYSCYETRT